MHVLKALEAVHAMSAQQASEMVGPTTMRRCMGDFAVQFQLLLSGMRSERQRLHKSGDHPVIAEIDRWVNLRIRPLLNACEDMPRWNEAHSALRWLIANTKATSELLTVWGKMDEQKEDDGLAFTLRKPVAADAPPGGGGKLPMLWNETAKAFRARSIDMPDWDEKTHRKEFLMRSGAPSHRSEVACDDQDRLRAFFVRDIAEPYMDVRAVGCVSSINNMTMEMLGLAQCILAGANKPEELATPLLIRLHMPRPKAMGASSMSADVVI